MTVEELITLLQKEKPWKQVHLRFERYYRILEAKPRATHRIYYPLKGILIPPAGTGVYLEADQKGDY